MDKLPVGPSPHRFLPSKTKYKNKAEPLEQGLQHSARQPSPPYDSKNRSVLSKRVPASSASDLYALNTPTEPNLPSPSNIVIVDPSTRAEKSQKNHSATGTEFGGRTEDGLGVGAESLVAGRGNAGTAGGRAERARALNVEGMWKGGESPANGNDERTEIPTLKQMQTQMLSQFKAAPRFRFGSSQRPRDSSPSAAVTGGNVSTHATQPRWRATQAPSRQSLRREGMEEGIADGDEGEILMEDVRESVERRDVDVDGKDYDDITYSPLDLETPAAKRRRVCGDPVVSFSYSRSQQDDAQSYDQGHAEANSSLQTDRLERNPRDQEDQEMLFNDDHELQEAERPFQDLSHPILSIHHPPTTTAPTQPQRPRFILPTSHTPRPSTPQQHCTQQVFAPTPHFVIANPSQASTHRDNEPPSTIRTFAPTPHFFITPSLPEPTNEPQFIKPPKFIHTEEPERMQPLPEEFSPRKRGQKFVVGGCASEVRGWLLDLESQNQVSSLRVERAEGRDEEGWVVKMVVDEVGAGNGVGWTIAKGDGMNVILGGEGIREGLEKGRELQRGAAVRIKAPVWEVEMNGVRWSVGANWRVWER